MKNCHDGDIHLSRQETDPEGDHLDPDAFPDTWEMRQPGMERLYVGRYQSEPQERLTAKQKRERKAERRHKWRG